MRYLSRMTIGACCAPSSRQRAPRPPAVGLLWDCCHRDYTLSGEKRLLLRSRHRRPL
jgi:hypothetical protein